MATATPLAGMAPVAVALPYSRLRRARATPPESLLRSLQQRPQLRHAAAGAQLGRRFRNAGLRGNLPEAPSPHVVLDDRITTRCRDLTERTADVRLLRVRSRFAPHRQLHLGHVFGRPWPP